MNRRPRAQPRWYVLCLHFVLGNVLTELFNQTVTVTAGAASDTASATAPATIAFTTAATGIANTAATGAATGAATTAATGAATTAATGAATTAATGAATTAATGAAATAATADNTGAPGTQDDLPAIVGRHLRSVIMSACILCHPQIVLTTS